MSFPRYPKYRDSGVEWLGQVPAHWDVGALKHAVRLRSGGTPDKSNPRYWNGSVPWASSKDLKSYRLADTQDHITEAAISDGAASLIEPGSLLIVVRGMILAHSFPVTRTLAPMAINQDLKAIAPAPGINSNFLEWLLRGSAHETFRLLDEAGHGTKALRMDAWRSMRVPLPPEPEQREIAEFLDTERVKIDVLIADERELIELLREKRQAVISHAVTKGLNSDRLMKWSGVEWLGDVPAQWDVVRLRFVAACLDSARVPLNGVERAKRPGTVPYWGANSIVDYVDQPLFNEDLVLLGEDGAPFFDKSKDVAFFVQGPIWPNNHVHVLRPTHPDTGRFMAHALNVTDFGNFIAGSTRDKLTQQAMKDIPLPWPPPAEQHGIVGFLASATGTIDALIAEAEGAIALLQNRLATLIYSSVTGRIDVRLRESSDAA